MSVIITNTLNNSFVSKLCACVRVCMSVYVRVCMYVCVCVRARMHVWVGTCGYMYMSVCMRACVRAHARVYVRKRVCVCKFYILSKKDMLLSYLRFEWPLYSTFLALCTLCQIKPASLPHIVDKDTKFLFTGEQHHLIIYQPTVFVKRFNFPKITFCLGKTI